MKNEKTQPATKRTAQVAVIRKALSVEEARQDAEGTPSQQITIERTIEITGAQMERLLTAPLANNALLHGLVGWTEFVDNKENRSLLVDTQGYDYARYIGIPVKLESATPAPKAAPRLTLFALDHGQGIVEILAINRAYALTWHGAKIPAENFLKLANGSTTSQSTDEGRLTLHTPRPAEFSDTRLVINSLEREVKTIERAVLSSIESLGRRLAEAQEAIEAGRTPSSCGIVQGMGTDLDSKVARLDQARSALASIKAATENDAQAGR